MSSLEQSRSLRELFEKSLAMVLQEISPERAFVAYKESGQQEFEPRGCHGIEPHAVFTTGEVSHEILKTASKEGKPLLLVDAIQSPGFSNRTSVILSGLRSILCVPIKHPSGLVVGLIYADNRLKAGAFTDDHLQKIVGLAKTIANLLVDLSKAEKEQREEAGSTPENAGEEKWAQLRREGLRAFREGQLEQALGYLEQAVTASRSFGSKDLRYAKTLNDLAELFNRTGESEKAERALIEAISIFEDNRQHTHIDLAGILNNLAGHYFRTGNRVRAEGLFRRAMNIWQNELGPEDRRLAPVYYNLGTLCQAQDKPDEARELFVRALQVATEAFGPEDPRTVKCRESLEAIAPT